MAYNRLRALQRRFERDKEYKTQYTAVIEEYKALGHMSKVEDSSEVGFYLPHHAVIKKSSATTRLRVVFDGSAKTTTGLSLNETLLVGPTIQTDLFCLLLRFRCHNYVVTADIEKMYRQVMVRPEDRKFQRILWQDDNDIQTYELNTVTFGITSAPFLAIRCLHQLADDEGQQFPNAAKILKTDLYVDDVLTGANTIAEVREIRDQLIHLLKRAGFNLRQWAANDARILDDLETEAINTTLQLNKHETLKTLRIEWNAIHDTINYRLTTSTTPTHTKRTILSEIAKIFDPLGLLGPIILYAKCIMQRLWQAKIHWDESIPSDIYTTWCDFLRQLHVLTNVTFDRKIILTKPTDIQLHGFCDASENGYGACIYLRSQDQNGNTQCKILCSKSRVAPLKTVSLPRLELCGAKVLANLYKTVINDITIPIAKTVLWSDSTIAINWINASPHQLKTFVANRVSDIQSKTLINHWKHIRSFDNPADALSRGQLPREFAKNTLWCNGPAWLTADESTWPLNESEILHDLPETRPTRCLATVGTTYDLLTRYSSFNKLKRIIAYCMRFKTKTKGFIQCDELQNAEKIALRLIQARAFAQELHSLQNQHAIERTSRLLCLNPFLDDDGLIRVGGRLKKSTLSFSQQHPIILPRSDATTTEIIREFHVGNHHAGIQTTLYAMRQRFWPINGRAEIRKVVRNCMRCFRANPPVVRHIMGDLPKERIIKSRPFTHVGIDYCGPFHIKERKHQNRKQIKIYVAVFVCFAVKAVHLEVVSDLTTEGCLGAFRRFIARRGTPQIVHSDNGTNFVGAHNELKELYALFNTESHQDKVMRIATDLGVIWKFIPPQSPHFGGLWENTVKSFKHHLKRVASYSLFTFEEFNTLVIEVEAILNSRPLSPLSNDPTDFLSLTPGHFLIGEPLTGLPEADYREVPSNRLSQWQHILKVRRDFWTRWHKEYLNELNVRHKWTTGTHSIREGSLVLLHDRNTPPLQWMLGRVVTTYPGEDGIIRTVLIKTTNGDYKRSVRQLSPLPINEEN